MVKKYSIGLVLALSAVAYADNCCTDDSCCPKDCYTSCCKSGCCPANCSDPCELTASSKTYFNVRPLYQTARAELISGFRTDRTLAREDGRGGAFDAVLFGGKSTKDRRLASYFMPHGKTTLVAAELPSAIPADINAANFGIDTTDDSFTSTFCLGMNQSVIGLGLHYKQQFAWDDELTRGWWFSASSPITRVQNRVEMCEDSGDEHTFAEGSQESMCEAFNQSDWNYGRIAANADMKKTRLADIEVKLGHEWLPCDDCHFGGYAGMLIPTGNKPEAGYVFEPIVGHGGHFGVMWGSDGGYKLWEHDEKECAVSVAYNIHSQYLFEKKQCRSFDLKDKPWSRYIKMYKNQEDAIAGTLTPGINLMTREVKVSPRFSHNLGAAVLLDKGGFQGELGTNVFCRQAECVKLACAWPTGEDAPALPDTDGTGLNPYRGIDITGTGRFDAFDVLGEGSMADEYQNYTITECDLDLQSAAHPAILSYTIHGALGYRWDECEYPVHINAGASYEFADDVNTVLNRWTVWGKLGFAF